MFTIEFEGLEELEREWDHAVASTLIEELRDAVERTSRHAMQVAQTEHKYQDRTGDLTSSIEIITPHLTPSAVDGGIRAGERYASFLENGTRKMKPYPFMKYGAIAAAFRLPEECERACEAFASEMNHG